MDQGELFAATEAHDPGGKVATALPPGMSGDAIFVGARNEYRPRLRRWIGETFPARHALLIGMNPSTASHMINDPTITREWGFTSRWGYEGFVKCNVADYRATYPSDLLAPGVVVRSDGNLAMILEEAKTAELVVIACGAVNRALTDVARETIEALRAAGVPMMTFGLTAAGWPKHPARLRNDNALVPF